MITEDLTVARLLDEHPGLVDVLADFHPHFRQLRNRLLRRVMAPRVTLGQAARIAGVDPAALLAVVRQAVGEAAPACESAAAAPSGDPGAPARGGQDRQAPGASTVRPAALAALGPGRRVELDVRDDVRRGVEPFGRIMAAVKALEPDQVLVLRAPFEPIPLYDVLGRRGLAHWTECRAPDDWSIWFYREAGAAAAAPRAAPAGAPRVETLDVRGLEPPLPMVRVLERLDALGPGDELRVVHDRRPVFLYPQLDDRGFAHETSEPSPGVVEIRIRPGVPGGRES
jgi:uncharacterized protein (DUF2249 family)